MTDRCWMACPPSRGSCLPLSPIVSPHLCRMVRRPPRGLVSHCLPTCVPVLDGTSLPEVLSPLVSHCLPTGVPVFDGASLVSPCLPLSPCSPCLSLSPGLSPSLSPSLSPILSPSLSLFLFLFVAGGLIFHFSLNSVCLFLETFPESTHCLGSTVV